MPVTAWSDSILIVELSDEPSFSEDMDSLLGRLADHSGQLPDVIVTARAVTYLNSSNISQLLTLRKVLLDGGVRLRLCELNDRLWSVMIATNLDQAFEFTDDVSTSLASLQIQE